MTDSIWPVRLHQSEKSFCPSRHYLPHRALWLYRPIKTNQPPIQFGPFRHQIVVSLTEHHGRPSSLFVFCCALSGAVGSNNCVSCSEIARCSLFLSALYWNLDLVPLWWLSPSVSEELMVSPSPLWISSSSAELSLLPPLILNFQYFLSSLAFLSARHISPWPLHFPPLALFVLFSIASPFSPLSNFTLASYLSSSIALFCFTSVWHPGDTLHVSGQKASECNLLNWNVMVRQHTRMRNS